LETPALALAPAVSSNKRNAVHDDDPGSLDNALSPGGKRQRISNSTPQTYAPDHLLTEEELDSSRFDFNGECGCGNCLKWPPPPDWRKWTRCDCAPCLEAHPVHRDFSRDDCPQGCEPCRLEKIANEDARKVTEVRIFPIVYFSRDSTDNRTQRKHPGPPQCSPRNYPDNLRKLITHLGNERLIPRPCMLSYARRIRKKDLDIATLEAKLRNRGFDDVVSFAIGEIPSDNDDESPSNSDDESPPNSEPSANTTRR